MDRSTYQTKKFRNGIRADSEIQKERWAKMRKIVVLISSVLIKIMGLPSKTCIFDDYYSEAIIMSSVQ